MTPELRLANDLSAIRLATLYIQGDLAICDCIIEKITSLMTVAIAPTTELAELRSKYQKIRASQLDEPSCKELNAAFAGHFMKITIPPFPSMNSFYRLFHDSSFTFTAETVNRVFYRVCLEQQADYFEPCLNLLERLIPEGASKEMREISIRKHRFEILNNNHTNPFYAVMTGHDTFPERVCDVAKMRSCLERLFTLGMNFNVKWSSRDTDFQSWYPNKNYLLDSKTQSVSGSLFAQLIDYGLIIKPSNNLLIDYFEGYYSPATFNFAKYVAFCGFHDVRFTGNDPKTVRDMQTKAVATYTKVKSLVHGFYHRELELVRFPAGVRNLIREYTLLPSVVAHYCEMEDQNQGATEVSVATITSAAANLG